jgi:hypothetical protein
MTFPAANATGQVIENPQAGIKYKRSPMPHLLQVVLTNYKLVRIAMHNRQTRSVCGVGP